MGECVARCCRESSIEEGMGRCCADARAGFEKVRDEEWFIVICGHYYSGGHSFGFVRIILRDVLCLGSVASIFRIILFLQIPLHTIREVSMLERRDVITLSMKPNAMMPVRHSNELYS